MLQPICPDHPADDARNHFCLPHDLGVFTPVREDPQKFPFNFSLEELVSPVLRVDHDTPKTRNIFPLPIHAAPISEQQ